MALDKSDNIYKKCALIARTKPKFEIDAEFYNEISSGFRLLPSIESTLLDKVCTEHYSLKTNEYLKCRWTQYVKNIEGRVFAPFSFPDIRDLHFYNCAIRIKPEESIHMMDHRMKLTPGPGVDSRGHLPIPQEAMMRRLKADKPKVKKIRKSAKK